MTIFARVGREYLLQVLAFALAVVDRLLIPAILLRTVGAEGFSAWTVAMSVAAFIPVLDLGITRLFSIRLLALQSQGRSDDAIAAFRSGTILLFAMLLLALIVVAVWIAVEPPRTGDPESDAMMPGLLLPVVLAMAVTQLINLRMALYRAHQQFARETIMRSVAEAVRVAAIVGAAILGASLQDLAWLWFGLAWVALVLPFLVDSYRRFPAFRERLLPARSLSVREVYHEAAGFWLAAMATTAFASVPILVLGYLAGSAAIVVQFGLMRTIANLVRQVLQLFANVFGLELGRRLAAGDQHGFAAANDESNRLLGVQAAVAAAVLLVIGSELFTVWTGRADLFDTAMLALAILPPILLPVMMLGTETMAYAGRQWLLVGLRAAQAVVVVLIFLILPVEHLGLRLMAALAGAEIVALGLPLLAAIRSIDPLLGFRRQLTACLWTYLAFGISFLIVAPALLITPDHPLARIAAATLLGAMALGISTLFLGMSATRRRRAGTAIRIALKL